MKGIKCVILASLIFSCFETNGQALVQNETKPYIEVTGTAELEIAPDEIIVDIIIRERYDGREKLTVDTQEVHLKNTLIQMGIDLKNLSLSAANAEYVNVKGKSKDVLTNKHFKLKLSDAMTVARLFEQLDKLDMNSAYISMMSHSKIVSLKKETRINAIKAAKEKADYLLNAIGSATGKPLMVMEEAAALPLGTTLNNQFAANYQNEIYAEGIMKKTEEDVRLKMIKVQSAITVRFLIQ